VFEVVKHHPTHARNLKRAVVSCVFIGVCGTLLLSSDSILMSDLGLVLLFSSMFFFIAVILFFGCFLKCPNCKCIIFKSGGCKAYELKTKKFDCKSCEITWDTGIIIGGKG